MGAEAIEPVCSRPGAKAGAAQYELRPDNVLFKVGAVVLVPVFVETSCCFHGVDHMRNMRGSLAERVQYEDHIYLSS